MQRLVLFSISFLWIFTAHSFGQGPSETKHDPNSSNPMITPIDKKIDAEIRHTMKRKMMIGLVVGILKNGKTT
jgi:hypothetical protein